MYVRECLQVRVGGSVRVCVRACVGSFLVIVDRSARLRKHGSRDDVSFCLVWGTRVCGKCH